jgi:hypothetical protein
MLPNQLKKDLRELQDLYQKRITADDLDEPGDAEVGDNTERSNELEGSPGEDAPNSQTLGGSAPNRAESSGMPCTASSDAPNPGGGYIFEMRELAAQLTAPSRSHQTLLNNLKRLRNLLAMLGSDEN